MTDPTPIHRLATNERWRGVEPYIGQRCTVLYRLGGYNDFCQTAQGIVLGAAHHVTNGNSTGDLILQCEPGHVWTIGGRRHHVISIALAHVHTIEPVTERVEATYHVNDDPHHSRGVAADQRGACDA